MSNLKKEFAGWGGGNLDNVQLGHCPSKGDSDIVQVTPSWLKKIFNWDIV